VRLAACILALALGAASAPAAAAAGAAPDFAAVTLAGDSLRLSSYRGRVVLLDFWASWCPPCRGELEALAKLEERLPDLVVLAVNLDTRRDRLAAFARRVRLPRRVLLDPTGSIAARYAPQAMPWTVLVDPQGRVAAARGGFEAGALPALEAEIRRLQASGR
jgi:thiol-disulfide isomerase/thioredoxin